MASEEQEVGWDELPIPEILSPAEMLDQLETVNVLAPLVRCSKLPFRHLCSLYETHITYTPMTLAEEFSRSQSARVSDFTTSKNERGVFWMEPRSRRSGTESIDKVTHQNLLLPNESIITSTTTTTAKDPKPTPQTYHTPPPTNRLPPTPTPPTPSSRLIRGSLIAQFASPSPKSLIDSAELISPYVDGIDINCGCPQKWAYHEGIGCALLRRPELVRDMVRGVQGRMGWGWGVSIKIRVDPDLRLTHQLITTALQTNVTHITIHGRTRHQPSTDPVSLPSIKFAVECVNGQVPCVGNGDIWELEDAAKMRRETGVRGVMGARGLLANPALFAGYSRTPSHAVEQFTSLSKDYGLLCPLFHRHLAYMLETHFLRPEKTYFNALGSTPAVVDYLSGRGLDFGKTSGGLWDCRRGRSLL